MANEFVFVDETGDTGAIDGSVHFGMVALHISASGYEAMRRLLATVRWSFSLYSEIKLGMTKRPARKILEGLKELGEEGLVSATGLCLMKANYYGRYLEWCELGVARKEWPLYLRHYLLRHLLELHFSRLEKFPKSIELIMDRISLSESQRANLLAYLDSNTAVPLKAPFRIPRMENVTIADSRYVGGLQCAHVLAEALKDVACSKAELEVEELARHSLVVASFLGKQRA